MSVQLNDREIYCRFDHFKLTPRFGEIELVDTYHFEPVRFSQLILALLPVQCCDQEF